MNKLKMLFVIVLGVALLPVISYSQGKACEAGIVTCIEQLMEKNKVIEAELELATPKGAIMAFDLPQCPPGWESFSKLNGRVVVGAGSATGLTTREHGENGGREAHALTVQQMPSHAHNHVFTNHQKTPKHVDYSSDEWGAVTSNRSTSATGGGQPHPIMQPYYVLTYCIKL